MKKRLFPYPAIMAILLLAFALSAFKGEDDAPDPFSFGLIADVQYCDGDPAGIRYYRDSIDKLKECVKDLNTHDLEFTVHLGDLIDRGFSSYDRVLPLCRQLEAPCYFALGNHDFSVEGARKLQVFQKLGMKTSYYEFKVKGWRFLVLDGNAVSTYAAPMDSANYREAGERYKKIKEKKAPNAMVWNGSHGKKQRAWIDQVLSEADQAGESVVLFSHFPVYPKNIHNCWDDEELIALFEKHACVVAYFNGHNHAGNYGEKKGIHYLTIQGMVDTKDRNAYAVAKVFKDRIEIQGVGRVPSRTLQLGIESQGNSIED